MTNIIDFEKLKDREYLNSLPDTTYETVYLHFLTDILGLKGIDPLDNDIFLRFCQKLPDFTNINVITSDLNIKQKIIFFKKKYNIKNKINHIIFPYFLIEKFWYSFLIQDLIKEFVNTRKKFNAICLICGPKIFRIMFLSKFYQHKNMIYSFFPKYTTLESNSIISPVIPYQHHVYKNKEARIKFKKHFTEKSKFKIQTITQDVNLVVPLTEFTIFENNFKPLDNIKDLEEFSFMGGNKYRNYDLDKIKKISHKQMEKDRRAFNLFVPKATFDSYFDINLESFCHDVLFISEKTFKSLSFRRPFITFSSYNFNFTLKKLGFHLYDELFDYSFDNEVYFEPRYNKFNLEIERLLSMDNEELYKIVQSLTKKIEKNFQLIKEKLKEKQLMHRILSGKSNINNIEYFKKYNQILNQ